MSEIKVFTFNPFQENTYILYDDTKEAIIIDPGCYETHERIELDEFISENELKIVKLINTHCHIDHVLGNAYIVNKYQVPLYIHPKDEANYRAVSSYSSNYGFNNFQFEEPTHFFQDSDTIEFGETTLHTRFAPGHAPGHIIIIDAKEKYIVGGDVLFHLSIGRTDLPGGDFDTLINSIHKQLFTLPDDYIVHPGHGPATSIGFEKANNPFCKLT